MQEDNQFTELYNKLDFNNPKELAKCFLIAYDKKEHKEEDKFDEDNIKRLRYYLHKITNSSYKEIINDKIRTLINRLDFSRVRETISNYATHLNSGSSTNAYY